MKLSRHAFTRFWSAHAWAGVVTSLLIYVMFSLGAVVLFYEPLTIWEEPLLQRSAPALPSLEGALALARPLPEEFYFYLPTEGRPLPKIGYYLPGTTLWRAWWIDVEHGTVIPQRELAAAFLYDLHYLWHDLTGFWLQYGAGVIACGFLLAIVTGMLIHWGRVLRQLQQFRPERERRVVWSDLHKVTGVFGLPFQLVYALTGSFMVLAPLLFQLSIGPVFGGDERRAAATAGTLVEDVPPFDNGAARRALPLDELITRARAAEPRLEVESVVYRGYGHEHGSIQARGPVQGEPFGKGFVRLGAASGAVEIVQTPDRQTAAGSLARYIHGLHTAEYGGLLVRCLLLVLALGGCLTILTGNWIWLERRRARGLSRSDRVLERLTAGVAVGTPSAIAALLAASRLIPLDTPRRAHGEELAMAGMLALWIVVSLGTASVRATYWRGLTCAGALLAFVPVLAARRSAAGLLGSGPRIEIVTAVDLGLLGAGLLLLALAWVVRRSSQRAAPAPLRHPAHPLGAPGADLSIRAGDATSVNPQ